jgi:hypothetical protein
MTYYVGNDPKTINDSFVKRYFYGLRRNDDGELFLVRLDQLSSGEENVVIINNEASSDENFPDFEEGIDFLDGIDANHNIEYENLRWPQLRWDGRFLVYYVEPETGQFVQVINGSYDFEDNISSDG